MNFTEICKASQKELKEKLESELIALGYSPQNEDGFLYAEGTVPVLLLAHMDTVHKDNCTIICKSENGDYIMSPQGIGGDDRCGIFMVLEIIKEIKCSVLFTEDEEKGCIGAHKFCKSDIKPDVNYCIEFDRKGKDDAVFYSCDNKEFETFITDEKIGFKTANGSCSDISHVAPYLGVAAVNLSCGYYNAHTQHEYVKLSEMYRNIQRAKEIIRKDCGKFEYVEKVYTYTKNSSLYGRYYDFYDYDYSKYYPNSNITLTNSETTRNSASDDIFDDYDKYTAEYDKLYASIYDNIDEYAIKLFDNWYDTEIKHEDLIPVKSIADYGKQKFVVCQSDGDEIPLEEYETKTNATLYIDKYCDIYKVVSDYEYGVLVAIKTEEYLISDEQIMYFADEMHNLPIMDNHTYLLFEDYIESGVFDEDIEDYITDILMNADT